VFGTRPHGDAHAADRQGTRSRTGTAISYELAKTRGIPGRSKMGKWDLIDALRQS
jgi:hypothetical protein